MLMIGNTVDNPILPKIRSINLPACLAPMVGLTHYPMRQMIRHYIPQNLKVLWPTEMLSSIKLSRQTDQEINEVVGPKGEELLAPQLLANEERFIEPSVSKLVSRNVAAIDINMGCPVKKALKHNYGVALMGDINYAAEVVATTVKHSRVPVSVKIRVGHNRDSDFLTDFSQAIVDSGASWICLHPRTAEEKRRGRADWTQIAMLADKLSVPVIGNGDIQTAEDAVRMRDETGCDMVMMGRALMARPWIMSQLAETWAGVTAWAPHSAEEQATEYKRACLILLDEMEKYYPENIGVRKFQFFIKVSSVWLEYGHSFTAKMSMAKSYTAQRVTIAKFFQGQQRMIERTELRY